MSGESLILTDGNTVTFSHDNVFSVNFPSTFYQSGTDTLLVYHVAVTSTGYKYDSITGAKEGPITIVESVDLNAGKIYFAVWDKTGNPYSNMSGPGWAAKSAYIEYVAIGRKPS